MKFFLFLAFPIISLSTVAQPNLHESYSKKFVATILFSNQESIDGLFMIDSLKGDSFMLEIQKVRNILLPLLENDEKAELYAVRLQADVPLINVNVHNPDKQISYGDFRIMFEGEGYVMIEDWIFLENQPNIDSGSLHVPPLGLPPPSPPD